MYSYQYIPCWTVYIMFAVVTVYGMIVVKPQHKIITCGVTACYGNEDYTKHPIVARVCCYMYTVHAYLLNVYNYTAWAHTTQLCTMYTNYLDDPRVDTADNSVQHPEAVVLSLIKNTGQLLQSLVNFSFCLSSLFPVFFARVCSCSQTEQAD